MSTEPKSTARRDKTDEWDFRKPVSTEPVDLRKETECTCDPEYAHRCPRCGGRGYVRREGESAARAQLANEAAEVGIAQPRRAVSAAAETAMTAEQDIQQVLDFYNNWHDHSDDFTPDRDTVGLVLAYAAHFREAAQGEIDQLIADWYKIWTEECDKAVVLRAKLAELEKAAFALHDKLKIILPKIDAIIGCQSMRTGMHVYDGPNIKEEMKLLASLRAESKEG